MAATIEQGNDYLTSVLNHVGVREDVPLLIKDASGAGPFAGRAEQQKVIERDITGGNVDYAAIDALINLDVGALFRRNIEIVGDGQLSALDDLCLGGRSTRDRLLRQELDDFIS